MSVIDQAPPTDSRPAARDSATLPTATTRPASQTSITRRRSHRSTTAPAGSCTSSSGSSAAVDTTDMASGDPVCHSTISGYATEVTRVARNDRLAPDHSSRKSRLR